MDDFSYYRRNSLRSFLWAQWLRFPSSFRCRVYRFLLAFGRTSSNSPDLQRLPFGLVYAKHGGSSVIQEALALQYVADYTSIPVPEVLDLTQDKSLGPIMIISCVSGTPLSKKYSRLDELIPDESTRIADVLRDWLNQLQYLRSPYGRLLCGYLGGAFSSYRISTQNFIGPYRSQNKFHDEPCCSLAPAHDAKIRSLASIIRQKRYDISFVHGNVSPENVLVDRDGVPIGLVGWECAAWMPSYWELTSGCWSVKGRSGESVWNQILVRCLPQYTDELKVDRELWRTYNPY